jgi:hypothetical protein
MLIDRAEADSASRYFWAVADRLKRGGFDLSRDPDGLEVAKKLWLEAVLFVKGLWKPPPPPDPPPDAGAGDEETVTDYAPVPARV